MQYWLPVIGGIVVLIIGALGSSAVILRIRGKKENNKKYLKKSNQIMLVLVVIAAILLVVVFVDPSTKITGEFTIKSIANPSALETSDDQCFRINTVEGTFFPICDLTQGDNLNNVQKLFSTLSKNNALASNVIIVYDSSSWGLFRAVSSIMLKDGERFTFTSGF